MELTKEYFDNTFKNHKKYFDKKFDEFGKEKETTIEKKFATKTDLISQTQELRAEFASKADLATQTKELRAEFASKKDLVDQTKELKVEFASKADLKSQTQELKAYADDQTEILAQIINKNITEPLDRHLQEVATVESVFMQTWKKYTAQRSIARKTGR